MAGLGIERSNFVISTLIKRQPIICRAASKKKKKDPDLSGDEGDAEFSEGPGGALGEDGSGGVELDAGGTKKPKVKSNTPKKPKPSK